MQCKPLIILGGIALVLAGCNETANPDYPFTAEADFSEDRQLTTQTRFSLAGINGTVEVAESIAGMAVRVSGTRRVNSDSQEDADARLEQVEVVIESSATELSVRTKQPNNTGGRSYEVDYVIGLPANLRVAVSNVNGVITVYGAADSLAVGGVNGSITALGLRGSAALGLVNGSIMARAGMPSGAAISAGTVNGSIELEIPATSSAMVDMELENGTITTNGLTIHDLQVSARKLTGRLGSGDGTITLGTVNGSLTLTGRSPTP